MARKKPGFAAMIREAAASMKQPTRRRAWGYKPSGEQKGLGDNPLAQKLSRRTKGGFASKLVGRAKKPRGR